MEGGLENKHMQLLNIGIDSSSDKGGKLLSRKFSATIETWKDNHEDISQGRKQSAVARGGLMSRLPLNLFRTVPVDTYCPRITIDGSLPLILSKVSK